MLVKRDEGADSVDSSTVVVVVVAPCLYLLLDDGGVGRPGGGRVCSGEGGPELDESGGDEEMPLGPAPVLAPQAPAPASAPAVTEGGL